jgi:tripartite-type tricarboxylate transporter receptor subunit TctC
LIAKDAPIMTKTVFQKVKICAEIFFTSAAFLLAQGAHAQTAANYPQKPVKVVVGYAAGGAVDVVARTLAQSLSSSMGQSFIVENKPGAGTNIAVKSVISAEADGYTLMLAANALAANMALYQPMPFDAEKELAAVSLVGRVPVVIAANPNVPFSTVAKLIEAAKAKPGQLAFASPGNGSTPHMAIEFFAKAAGIDSGAARNSLRAGHAACKQP